jgi:hypothetical protein
MVPNFSRWEIENLPQLFEFVVEILLILISLAAFLGILYAGFKYLTAGSGEITQGKKALLNSILGLLIAALSLGIVTFVIRLVAGE